MTLTKTTMAMDLCKTLTALLMAASLSLTVQAEKLVILHTNDTHSQIMPTDADLGGVARRKTLVDSVRAAEKNVMLIDLGDAVQGTSYFTLYKGEVENRVMDLLGYDIAILGNHEFDNGAEELAKRLETATPTFISSNYSFDGPMADTFRRWTMRDFGKRRIAFIGLNLRPHGMIADGNYNGVVYEDAIEVANRLASRLRAEMGADMVVALTHVGYDGLPAPKDVDIAAKTRGIDLILGGHSHTYINEADSAMAHVRNLDGETVVIAQAGKQGTAVGEVTIDLDDLSLSTRLIPVTNRLDKPQPAVEQMLQPYNYGVDSLMSVKLAYSDVELERESNELRNFLTDFVLERGRQIAPNGKVDLAINNKGSIRRSLAKGDVTLGMVMDAQPFRNTIEVLEIKGSDLIDALNVMATRGGDLVSHNVDITMDKATMKCKSIKIDGKNINPSKTYRVATIDYLANGGDYMEPLTKGKKITASPNIVQTDLIDYLKQNFTTRHINPSDKPRMHF